jgi:hypothetical protein
MEADVAEIDAWLRASGMSESRLGNLAAANSAAIKRIRNGSARVDTLHAVLRYIRANPMKK